MKSGIVYLVGRPNVGKSTLANALVGQKVSITSPKPQTTRFNIQAVYEDERGQIVFVDPPGIFGKAVDDLAKKINTDTEASFHDDINVVAHIIDPTRRRDFEENRVLGIVRQFKVPKILVINKMDLPAEFLSEYKFMEDEHDKTVELSAATGKNVNLLLQDIFELLPEGEKLVDTSKMTQPALNLDSKTYIAELIREKAFLFLRREAPYSLTTVVDEIDERENGVLYVKGRIITSADTYKIMIIGKGGTMIKEISMATRKELETASNKKVYVDLKVETDPHWIYHL